jgi:hypothetical protein
MEFAISSESGQRGKDNLTRQEQKMAIAGFRA